MKLDLLTLLLLVTATFSQKQLYYLIDEPFEVKPAELQELENNPYNVPIMVINCKADPSKCVKFKVKQSLPQLVIWPGPGSGYRCLGVPSSQALKQFFDRIYQNPIFPIRDFFERISFTECMAVAGVAMGVLHLIFSAIFKDRSGLGVKQKEG